MPLRNAESIAHISVACRILARIAVDCTQPAAEEIRVLRSLAASPDEEELQPDDLARIVIERELKRIEARGAVA